MCRPRLGAGLFSVLWTLPVFARKGFKYLKKNERTLDIFRKLCYNLA
jgi:hypothetical protein